jgi:hypothetical protein
VDLEQDPPEPEADEPPEDEEQIGCVEKDERNQDCATCPTADKCTLNKPILDQLSSEPAGVLPPNQILVIASAVPSLESRVGKQLTHQDYRDSVDVIKLGILAHVSLNQTKSLEMCAASYLFLRANAMPSRMAPADMIQVLSEVMQAYRELLEGGIVSREVTPPGTLLN